MTSDTNVIPATASGSGPMFNPFPNEIYIEIFRYCLGFCPETKTGRVIDSKYFNFLNRFGTFHCLSRVSRHFQMLAALALYENNSFNFWRLEGSDYWSPIPGALTPILPPITVRHFLRRMSITLALRDYYIKDITGHPSGSQPSTTQIATVEEFLQHSVGGRSLRTLTNATTGFSNLHTLHITIKEDFIFRCNPAVTIAVIKAAQLNICARQVTVEIVKRDYTEPLDWCPDLANAIITS